MTAYNKTLSASIGPSGTLDIIENANLTVGQMTYNGIQLGPGGIAGIASVSGLTALPDSRNGDVSRPNADGMLGGYDFMGARNVTMNLEVEAIGSVNMPVNLEALAAAMIMSKNGTGGVYPAASQVLTFNLGAAVSGAGVNRRIAARVRKFDAPVDVEFAAGSFQHGLARVAVMLSAIDPLIYDATTQIQSVGLTVATGGLTFPVTFPVTFGSQSGGFIYATNAGSVPGPAYMTITGPCQNPRIEQQTTGVTLQFNMSMSASDSLVIDTFYGSATLNGTASRLNDLAPGSYIPSFNLQPGMNTIGFYSSDATATAAQLTLEWASTWAS